MVVAEVESNWHRGERNCCCSGWCWRVDIALSSALIGARNRGWAMFVLWAEAGEMNLFFFFVVVIFDFIFRKRFDGDLALSRDWLQSGSFDVERR